MNKKVIILFITILILSQSFCTNAYATNTNIKKDKFGSEKVKIFVNNEYTSVDLSLEKAEDIKERFLRLEKDFEGIEKINKQIQILKEIEILPSNFSIEVLLSKLDNVGNKIPALLFKHLKLTIGGPLIISHLTIGGRIKCLFSIKSPFYNSTNIKLNGILNNSYINKVAGALPIYIGATFKPVFITVIGPKIVKSSKIFLLPFFEILVPCIGFSIAFVNVNKKSQAITLFEYNLDGCFFGFIAGF